MSSTSLGYMNEFEYSIRPRPLPGGPKRRRVTWPNMEPEADFQVLPPSCVSSDSERCGNSRCFRSDQAQALAGRSETEARNLAEYGTGSGLPGLAAVVRLQRQREMR